MSADKIFQVIDPMDPEEALDKLTPVLKKLFSHLGDEARMNFVVNLVGEAGADKLGSLVHY
ncbi:MAG: hypothetical protein FJ126_07550 [Deltaproteobacteria bacterium]|nr:hypothetical protein [Deltaproteobacteria bacterium]